MADLAKWSASASCSPRVTTACVCEGRGCKCAWDVCGEDVLFPDQLWTRLAVIRGCVYLNPVVVAVQFILKVLVFLLKVLHSRQIVTKIVPSHQQPLLPIWCV